MKSLVIGGNGFIGSHLVDKLILEDHEVVILDVAGRRFGSLPDGVHYIQGDLTNDYLVREALTGVDIVYHLAWTSIHELSNRNPVGDIQLNLIPAINLIDACCNTDVKRIVFISSGGTIYGPARSFPITEEHPQNPINSYGITKLAVEKYLKMYSHIRGVEYSILRPSVPYGPRQNPISKQGAVAVIMYKIANSLPVTIWGDGSTSRDFFYISDLTSALIAAAEKPLNVTRIFNIGGVQEISLNHLIDRIEKVVGKTAAVVHEPARNFDAPRIVLDTSAAKQHLAWQPKVSLDQGLQLTWDWMQELLK